MNNNRISNISPSNHQAVSASLDNTESALASATSSLAHALQTNTHNGTAILQALVRSIPESAPNLIEKFPAELAPDHGLAMLYNALNNGSPAQLPSPEFLQKDLNDICKIQVTGNHGFLATPLNRMINQCFIPALSMTAAEFEQKRDQMVNLFNLGNVLVKSLKGEAAADNKLHELGAYGLKKLHQFCRQILRLAPPESHLRAELNELIPVIKQSHAIAFVSKNPMGLERVHARYKNNMDVVMAAVQKNGLALQHASTDMKNNPRVVLAAVQNNGMALEHASMNLQTDHEIVVAAMRQNPSASTFANLGMSMVVAAGLNVGVGVGVGVGNLADILPQPPAGVDGNANLRDLLDDAMDLFR